MLFAVSSLISGCVVVVVVVGKSVFDVVVERLGIRGLLRTDLR